MYQHHQHQFAEQNTAQANNWATQRRDAIEKAKRLRDDHKYSLALTGKMSLGSGQPGVPINKHGIPGLRSTGPVPSMSKPSVSEGYSGTNTLGYGHRRPMSNIYDKPISEEDLQQAASSLRLLKAKMKSNNERMASRDGDLLDSFAEKPSSQPMIQTGEYGYPVKRQYQGAEVSHEKAQSLNEISSNLPAVNKNYRKVFKPNLKQDDQDSLTSHMESRKENLSRQSNVKKEEPFGTGAAAKVIPSRISKNTLEKPANKVAKENERILGAKRGKLQEADFDEYGGTEEHHYKPAQKQQYQPPHESSYKRGKLQEADFEEYGATEDQNSKPAQKQQYQPPLESSYNPSKYTISVNNIESAQDDVESSLNQLRAPGFREPVRNSLMVDPDERALKNSRVDVFHEGNNERPSIEKALMNCPEGCGRQFFEDVIEKHAKACAKVFQTKRKKFDMAQQRMTEEQQIAAVKKPASKTNLTGLRKKETEQAIKGIPKWKRESELLRAGMKKARGEELTWQEKVVVAKSEEDDFVHCEFCSRKFSEKAAEKHIPFCQSKAKKEALKRPARPTRPLKKL